MAESDVTVVMTGDDARLEAAQRRAAKNQDGLTESVGRTGQGARSADSALEKFATRLARDNAKPLEKAQQHLGQIQKAYDRVLITHQTYDRSVRETVRNLSQQAKISQDMAADRLGVSRRFSTGERPGGDSALAGLPDKFTSMIGLFGGITSLTSLFTTLQEIKGQNKEQSQEMLRARAFAPSLLQVSRTPEEYAERKRSVEELLRSGATGSTGAEGMRQAQELEAVIHGAGMDKQAPLLAELAARRIIKPEDLAGVVDKLDVLRNTVAAGQDPLKTLAQAMSVRGNVSVALPEMLEIMGKIGERGRQTGMTAADTTALAVTMAEVMGTARKAASGSEAIMEGLTKFTEGLTAENRKQFEKLTFTQRVEKVQGYLQEAKAKGGEEDFKKVFGDSFVEPFQALANNLAEYNERRQAAQSADVSLLKEKITASRQDIDAILDHAKRTQEAAGQFANQNLGRLGTAADALMAARIQAKRQSGASEDAIAYAETEQKFERKTKGDTQYLREAYKSKEELPAETRNAIRVALSGSTDPNAKIKKESTWSFRKFMFGRENFGFAGAEPENIPTPVAAESVPGPAPVHTVTRPTTAPPVEVQPPAPQTITTTTTVAAIPPTPPVEAPPALPQQQTFSGPGLQEALDAAIQMGAADMEREIRNEMTAKGIVPKGPGAAGQSSGVAAGDAGTGATAGVPLALGGMDTSTLERLMGDMLKTLQEQNGLMRERRTGGQPGSNTQPPSRRGELLQEAVVYG